MTLSSLVDLKKHSLVLTLMCVLSAFVLADRDAEALERKGWVIEQDSQVYGEQQLSVSRDSIRMRLPAMHVLLLMHSPKWNVSLFNEKTRKVCEYTLQEWTKFCAGETKQGHREAKYIWHEVKPETIAGIHTRHFQAERFLEVRSSARRLAPNTVPEKPRDFVGMNKQSNVYAVIELGDKKHTRTTIPGFVSHGIGREIWITKELSAPAQLMEALSYSSGVAVEYGIPLRIIEFEDDGTKKVLLSTTKVTKSTMTARDLEEPKGFTRVKDFMAIVLDSTRDDALNDLLGEPRNSHPVKKPSGFSRK